MDSAGNLQASHTDGLGSVRAITDNNGNVIQTYQTDAFGVPTSVQGTSAQPFQFTGQQQDYNGLIDLRARYYDPSVGRFLSRDPLAGSLGDPLSLNRYAYVADNPVTLVDPSGMVAQVSQDAYSRALVGMADNQCFSSGGGTLSGYVVNAGCIGWNLLGQSSATIRTPVGAASLVLPFAAPKPPSEGGGVSRGALETLAQRVAAAAGAGAVKVLATGYKVEVPISRARSIVVRIMQSGGIRSGPYYRISVAGKDTFTQTGAVSTNPLLTHIDVSDVDAAFREITNIISIIQGGK